MQENCNAKRLSEGQCTIYLSEVPKILPPEEEFLKNLPKWRKSKALSYCFARDKFLCAEAYHLLSLGLNELYGISCQPSFIISPFGKPSLEGYEGIFFNISHCNSCVCCAFADRELGVDVEDIKYHPEIAEYVLNSSELESVTNSSDRALAFTRLWTRKESVLKMTGEGLRDDLKDLLPFSDCRIKTFDFPKYCLSYCLL